MTRTISLFLVLAVAAGLFVLVFRVDEFFSDSRVQQAYVAGSFLAIGWMVSFAFREFGNLLERRQRSLDIQHAVNGEIFDYSEALQDDDYQATLDEVRERVLGGGDDPDTRYHPFVPRVSKPVIFEAMVEDVYLLPEDTIYTVVQFYSLLSDVNVFAEDLMSDLVRQAPATSRAAALNDYLAMRRAAYDLAIESNGLLNASIRRQRGLRLTRLLGITVDG